jgi:hypothetical protein
MTIFNISVEIPETKKLPSEIANFTPEENYAMLVFGMEHILSKKNPGYISHIASLEKQIEELKNEKLEKYQKLLENTAEKLNHFCSNSTQNTTENSTEDKRNFRSLAIQTFRDFQEFDILDTTQGDYQLKFKDFSVLVDAKYYSTNITCKVREKLKSDLLKSDTCFFGWLVSMETSIDRFDKSNFMFEWLSGNKCICYINSLAIHEDPLELLRSIYFTCQTIHKITNVDAKEITELHQLKDNENRVREISQKIIQNSLERDEMLNLIKSNFQKNDEMIRQILNKETNTLVDKRFSRIIDWWNFHLINEEGHTMRSSNIWTMFKRDNPDLVGEIQANDFKDIIYTFISNDRIVKPRNKFGALEIKNLRWKVDRGNAEN